MNRGALLALGQAVAGAVLALALAGAVHAATPAPGPNDACLGCHGGADVKAADGRSVAVDAAAFGGSVHGSMQLPCTACHTDVSADKFPHGQVKPVDCASCHEKAVAEYKATVHGVARAGGSQAAATCTSCHGSHDILRTAEPTSRTNHANLEKTCGACHTSNAGAFHDSLHGQAMAKKTSAQNAVPTCTNCHGAHDMRPKSDPMSKVARANVPATCGSCHMGVKAVWEKSQHGRLRASNVMQAPGCTDCHNAHGVQQHEDPRFKLAVTDSCATCHADFASSYRDTFHGQVTQLGFTQIATCASCHGAHEVLPKDNPLSRVSAQNRVATCQTCHPKANASFATFDPHANKHDRQRGQILFFTGKFMELLLFGVFAFFGIHTVLWFVRSLKAVKEKRAKPTDSSEKH